MLKWRERKKKREGACFILKPQKKKQKTRREWISSTLKASSYLLPGQDEGEVKGIKDRLPPSGKRTKKEKAEPTDQGEDSLVSRRKGEHYHPTKCGGTLPVEEHFFYHGKEGGKGAKPF